MAFKRTLLALGAALIAGGLWMAAPQRAMAADTAAASATQDLPAIPDMSIGNPDAKVHVIEYLSFTCPHCEEFHATVWPKIKKNYIDNGKIRFTIREVYFDKYGLWAGMMAQCGGAMRYFGIVDMLYNQQREWAGTSDPNQAVANLRKIGLAAGISSADLDKCMTDGKMAQAMVAKFQKDTAADHIEGTPSFVIDGTTHQNMGYEEFAKILDAELAKSK
ncbi:MAG: DsbA family protein [Paracoccaceae bacterium]|nr:DsbA family protein [Paracoccaceae bacterium]